MTDKKTMLLALEALLMSSPHTDALHRWKDESWIQQRSAAIAALRAALEIAD